MNKVAFVKVTLSVMLLAAFHTAKTSELEHVHVWTKLTLGFISQKQLSVYKIHVCFRKHAFTIFIRSLMKTSSSLKHGVV